MTAQNLLVFEKVRFFMIFSLKKNLDVKKINRTSISQPNSGVHSGVANLESNYDCSNPFSFRDMAFFMIFSCFFFFNLDIKKVRYKKLTEL